MARPKTMTEAQRKSARVSLLLTQMLDDVTTLAQIRKVSLNDLFTSLAAQLIKKNRQAIDEVQSVMSKVSPTVEITLDFEEVT